MYITLGIIGYLLGMVLFTRFANRKLRMYKRDENAIDIAMTIIYPFTLALCIIINLPNTKLFKFIWKYTFGWALKD